MAVLLTLAWPLYILISALLFILKALAYGVFLVAFTAALILLRKPFILKWLGKAAVWLGDFFLKANTYLIRLFFPKAPPQPA